MDNFVKSFPIILSTTFSLRNSIPGDFLFDYVIIDESSQVDLLAGSLALSCAKNAIIVGDTKQLPQIVDLEINNKLENSNVDECYDYFKNSILSSISNIYISIPKKLLKDHYRCHPKIIEFCNKRYYNGKLTAYANDEHLTVDNPLVLYYTAKGNHMRKYTRGEMKGTFNERELEVIKEEVLNDKRIKKYSKENVGIITPYRLQADRISSALDSEYESDTVHKYQGREKDLMILSTVLDNSYLGKQGIKFVDNPCMINVAVSRAIKQFVLVTHPKVFNELGEEVNALLKYIKYNTLDSEIVNSNIVSVFDLLYKDYDIRLRSLDNRLLNRCRYKSERIVDTILNKEFEKQEYNGYYYLRQVCLRSCLKYFKNLTKEEKKFINNFSSVDFVIYKDDNIPILFIEVDGFEFHENNPKQLKRDRIKESILKKNNLNLERIKVFKKYSEEDICNIVKEKVLNSKNNN